MCLFVFISKGDQLSAFLNGDAMAMSQTTPPLVSCVKNNILIIYHHLDALVGGFLIFGWVWNRQVFILFLT